MLFPFPIVTINVGGDVEFTTFGISTVESTNMEFIVDSEVGVIFSAFTGDKTEAGARRNYTIN